MQRMAQHGDICLHLLGGVAEGAAYVQAVLIYGPAWPINARLEDTPPCTPTYRT